MNQMGSIDMGALAEEYVRLRDFKKQEKDKFEAYLKEHVNDRLEAIEAIALEHLNATNTDSVKTPNGTIYRKKYASVTVADAREFQRYVIGGGLWSLADIRASKTGVEEFLQEHNELPPGVNYSAGYDIGVRRNTNG